MHVNIDLPSNDDCLTHIPEQVPIYTPVWCEAIKIRHFAWECKHGGTARIRARDPLIKGLMPNHFGHHALQKKLDGKELSGLHSVTIANVKIWTKS